MTWFVPCCFGSVFRWSSKTFGIWWVVFELFLVLAVLWWFYLLVLEEGFCGVFGDCGSRASISACSSSEMSVVWGSCSGDTFGLFFLFFAFEGFCCWPVFVEVGSDEILLLTKHYWQCATCCCTYLVISSMKYLRLMIAMVFAIPQCPWRMPLWYESTISVTRDCRTSMRSPIHIRWL